MSRRGVYYPPHLRSRLKKEYSLHIFSRWTFMAKSRVNFAFFNRSQPDCTQYAWRCFPVGKVADVWSWLTTHLHPAQKLRVSRAVTPLPLVTLWCSCRFVTHAHTRLLFLLWTCVEYEYTQDNKWHWFVVRDFHDPSSVLLYCRVYYGNMPTPTLRTSPLCYNVGGSNHTFRGVVGGGVKDFAPKVSSNW
jgi:hypothetical protein